MFRTIQIDTFDGSTKDVEFLANAATPRRYKAIFGNDLLQLFVDAKREENGREIYSIDFIQELAFVMAMQAKAKSDDKVKLDKLNENSFVAWLEEFDSMALENKASEIMSVYMGNMKTDSEAKKNIEEQSEK